MRKRKTSSRRHGHCHAIVPSNKFSYKSKYKRMPSVLRVCIRIVVGG